LNEMDNMLDEIDAAAEKKPFGQEQSPINIISACHSTTQKMTESEAHSSNLKFNYPALVEGCTIMHNGYTVQINIPSTQKCTLAIKGKTYKLVQFHFHTPAEHAIDSKIFDMEMHLVHANEKSELAVLGFIFAVEAKYYKPKLQLTQSRAHLVLSKESMLKDTDNLKGGCIPVDESDDCETDDEWVQEPKKAQKNKKVNDFLKQFFDQLPSKKTSKDIPLKKPLSFDSLFETSSNTFTKNIKSNEIDLDMEMFEYDGGLTTPPYSEGVQWLVAKRIQYIGKKQLSDLSACWGNKNNARLCQKYCGRVVKLRNTSSMQVV